MRPSLQSLINDSLLKEKIVIIRPTRRLWRVMLLVLYLERVLGDPLQDLLVVSDLRRSNELVVTILSSWP